MGCDVGERVWGYSDLPFPSPSFPAGLSPPDPTELNVPASDGAAQDNHSTPGTFVQPYNWHSVSVSQIYRYRCPCNDNNAWVTMSGPLAIERMVQLNSQTSKWRFLIRKSHPGEAKIDPLPNQ